MKKLLTLATMTVLLMILMGCDGTSPTTEPHRPLETPVTQTPTPTAGSGGNAPCHAFCGV